KALRCRVEQEGRGDRGGSGARDKAARREQVLNRRLRADCSPELADRLSIEVVDRDRWIRRAVVRAVAPVVEELLPLRMGESARLVADAEEAHPVRHLVKRLPGRDVEEECATGRRVVGMVLFIFLRGR